MGCDYIADEKGVLKLTTTEGASIVLEDLEPFAKVYADEYDIPQDAYVDVGVRR